MCQIFEDLAEKRAEERAEEKLDAKYTLQTTGGYFIIRHKNRIYRMEEKFLK